MSHTCKLISLKINDTKIDYYYKITKPKMDAHGGENVNKLTKKRQQMKQKQKQKISPKLEHQILTWLNLLCSIYSLQQK